MQKVKFILVLLIVIMVTSACAEPKVVDDIKLISGAGYDYVDDDHIRGTISAPIFPKGSSGGSEPELDTISVLIDKGQRISTMVQMRSDHPIVDGELQVVLYGKKLAQEGLHQYWDILNRDQDMARDMNLAIVDGSSLEVLGGDYPTSPLTPELVHDLIEQNQTKNFPTTNLHTLLYSYYGEGMDPFLPLIKKKGEHIQLEGIALFKGTQMIDHIPFSQAYIFKSMYEDFDGGIYSVPWKKNEYIYIQNVSSNVHYKVKNGLSDQPEITLFVEQEGYIQKANFSSGPKHYIKAFEKRIEQQMDKNGTKMLKRFQELGIDPLRLGDIVRSHTRGWNVNRWVEHYKNAKIDLVVEIKLTETGVIK